VGGARFNSTDDRDGSRMRPLVGSGKHVRHVKVFTTTGISRDGLIALVEQVSTPIVRRRSFDETS
jgi:hypothetical protein